MAQSKDITLVPFENKLAPHLFLCSCGSLMGQIKTNEWFVFSHHEDIGVGVIAHLQECGSCREEKLVVRTHSSQEEATVAVRKYIDELRVEKIKADKEQWVPSLPFALEYELPPVLLEYLRRRIEFHLGQQGESN